MKKRIFTGILTLLLLLCGCAKQEEPAAVDVLATTEPVFEIVTALLEGTELQSGLLISESVSCLHDYALSVAQMKAVEQAKLLVINGGGLESFMEDVLSTCPALVDASAGLLFLPGEDGIDPHVWLAPENMMAMTSNVADSLAAAYPQQEKTIRANAQTFRQKLVDLQTYGEQQLSTLSGRALVTFHDGFAYFAAAFDLELAASMEIESGSEPSARELEQIIALIQSQQIPAVFTETNGTTDAAELVARETGCAVYSLDTAIGTQDYFAAMRGNLDTIKEALG